ncbi:MAG: fibronectin type III domain-containing protein [Candidatus Diapherotrites archaeon]|nr:fibronectin type III domain-containing protein [Candidatus Diapherotrites archaeon]
MDLRKIIVLFAFISILTSAIGAPGTQPEIKDVTINETTNPVYIKKGDQITISFSVKDLDVNADSNSRLNVELYYSTAPGTFENLIGDYNLSDTSKEYCPTNNFQNFVDCSIRWQTDIDADGNYYIDLNFYEKEGETINDSNQAVSINTMYVDNTPPEINVLQPVNVVCGSTTPVTTDARRVIFDLNDFGSGTNISNVSVTVELLNVGSQTSSFESNSCTAFDGNYHCDYYEYGMYKSGIYHIKVNASDNVGNTASCTFDLNFSDNNAPAQVKGLGSDAGAAKITLSWTANTEKDLNGYKIYYSTQNCEFTKESGTYAGFTTQTSYTLSDLNSDLNYYIKVLAVDYTGNEGPFSDCERRKPNPAQAPSAPTLTSSTHSNDTWSNKNDVTITWNAVSNATGYSCTWSTDASDEPDAMIDADEWCSGRSLEKNDLSDGTYYLKVRACASNGNCSGIASFTVKIDTSKPTQPANFSASLESDGDIRLDWDASSDSGSGVKEYRIYRSTSSDFTPSSDNRVKITTGTNWTDTDVETGKTYYYKIKAFDYAGNESDAASTSITTEEISVTIEAPSYAKAGSIDIRIKASDTLENAYVYIKKEKDVSWTKIAGPKTSKDFSVSYEFVKGDDGIAKIKVTADNLTSEIIKSFEVDTKAPEITWINPKPGEKVTGICTLKVKTEEPATRLKKVTFYYNDLKIAEVTQAAEQNIYWVANWDTNRLSAGSYTLKAVAEDKAGNEGVATITAVVEKPAQPEPEEKKESEAKIEEVTKRKKEALAVLQKTKSYELPISSTTDRLYNQALELLDEANSHYASGDYKKALEKADRALQKLEEFSSSFGFAEVKTRSREISIEDAANLLRAHGFSDIVASEAAELTGKSNARKTVKVLMVKDNNVEKYYVKVFLQFKTDLNNVHVVEFVPKALAESSEEIEANKPFEVLEEDPVLLFKFEGIKPGEITIEYSLKKPLTKENYEKLKDTNAFEPAPFAIIKVAEAVTVKPAEFPWMLAVGLILTVIIIVGCVALFYFTYAKKGVEERTALAKAIADLEKKAHFRLPKIEFGKKRKEKKLGRWAYRGK